MKKVIAVLVSFLFLTALLAYLAYGWIYKPNSNLTESKELLIKDGTSIEQLTEALVVNDFIRDKQSFKWVSWLMKFDNSRLRSGRYLIEPQLSNRQLINKLRLGLRDPILITLSNARTIGDIASQASRKIAADSLEILNVFTDSYLDELGIDANNKITLFLPDTYELYWNTSGKEFINRMRDESRKYWADSQRQDALQRSGLSKEECMTLASIVEKETNQVDEKATIAGVYLNRISQGIPLQADPTVIYGVGDFTIRRVLYKHLNFDSPYNTYLYKGLPPGPICMPSKSSIEAVLNAESHDYLFFCARPGYNGGHNFAKTNAEHERNAREYRNWLNKEGIRG